MSTVLSRTAAAVRARYERTGLAQYGAGLHTDCDDCGTAPVDVEIPGPRCRVDDRAAADRRIQTS